MRVLSKIDEISSYAGVNKHKVKELMINGTIPAVINESTNRNYFYTSDTLIDYVVEKVMKKKNIEKIEGNKDVFLRDDLDNILSDNNKCITYAVTNQKGGVAKTTISVNLASTLAFLNKRVLLVDMDSQSQSSRYLNKEQYAGNSIVNILNEILQNEKISKEFVDNFITEHEVVNDKTISVLPSELRLSKILELCRTATMSHTILKKIINTVEDDFDFIIIDLPPSSGVSIEMALYAADRVILATDCDEFSKEGIEVTLEGVKTFNENVGKNLKIDSCFISKYNNNIKAHQQLREELIELLEEKGLEKEILYTSPYNLVIPDSQREAVPLIGFFQKETYNSKNDTYSYVSMINQSLHQNKCFFEYAIKMIKDAEQTNERI